MLGTTTSAFAQALAARRNTRHQHCCRVGELVALLDPDSRADIIDALAEPIQTISHVAIADALHTVLADLGIKETVSKSTVGDHRNNRNNRHEIS